MVEMAGFMLQNFIDTVGRNSQENLLALLKTSAEMFQVHESQVCTTIKPEVLLSRYDFLVIAGSPTAQAIQLPPSEIGKQFLIKKTSAKDIDVTITAINGKIEGKNSVVLKKQYELVWLVSDGTDWLKII